MEAYVSSFNIILLISRWCWSCLSALYSYAAYYRGAMGILLVYDVTDESSFNSKFSYRLTISLQILRNLNSLPILLLFYCQHVLLAFSVFAWVISIPVCCLIFVQYMCCMYLCVGNQQHLFLVCFLFHRDEFVKDLLTDIVELLLHLVGLSSIVQHP